MTKIYCDQCKNETDSSYKLSVYDDKSDDAVVEKEICDNCYSKIIKFIKTLKI